MTIFCRTTPSLAIQAADDARLAAACRSLPLLPTAHWILSGVLVLAAVELAARFVPLCTEHPLAQRSDLIADMTAWDGYWYLEIAMHGYSFDPKAASSVAFFPAYPLLSRLLAEATRLRADAALVVVSNGCFFAAVLVAAAYARERMPPKAARLTIAALTWFPTTFYFRMAYSESLMLLLIALVLYGIHRAWPLWSLALLVGGATAIRPIGVTLVAPLAMDVWSRRPAAEAMFPMPRSARALAAGVGAAVPMLLLACWGLLAFVAFQARAFGEPFAFVKAHALWNTTLHHDFFWERAARLASLEPLRAVYDPGTSSYWGLHPPRGQAALNMMFGNPIYFLGTAAAIVVGAAKRWLAQNEVVLAALLLLVPYALRADQTCMASQARFASVVLPAYFVWGHLMARLSPLVLCPIALVSAGMLAVYASLFVSWYWYY